MASSATNSMNSELQDKENNTWPASSQSSRGRCLDSDLKRTAQV